MKELSRQRQNAAVEYSSGCQATGLGMMGEGRPEPRLLLTLGSGVYLKRGEKEPGV